MARSIFQILIVLLLFFSAVKVEAGFLRTLKHGLDTCRLYKKVQQGDLVEITGDLLESGRLDPEAEEAIRKRGRRVFLFQYPSDGMQIKGYISFVPGVEKSKLIVLLRGGSSLYLIRSPESPVNYWGDHTIISTTYRGGPSPGRDEFGGADVNDVKHLIDFIPTLQQKLGVTFNVEERVALGFSRGAMQLFTLLNRYPELSSYFDRAAVVCGLLDLEQFLKSHPSAKRMIRFFLFQRTSEEWIRARCPLSNAEKYPKDLPLLVVQGGGDSLVNLSVGKVMVKKLRERGCTVDYREHPTAGHCSRSLDPLIFDYLTQIRD